MDFILFMKKIKNTIRLSFAIIALLLAGCSNNSLNTNSNSLDSSDTTSETSSGISSETSSETTSNSGNDSNSSSNSETSQGGGSQEYDGYYASISSSDSGETLLSKLRSLNSSKRKSTVGYKNMGTSASGPFRYTDYDPDSVKFDSNGQPYGTKVISFYSGKSITSFNKEHVWPDSHGGNKVEADIHMPRPTVSSENGSRGNSFYVEGEKSGTQGWDPAEESFGIESYRGDSARIVFYCVVASSSLSLVDLDYHSTSRKNNDNMMGKLSDLLKWNLRYNVDEREQRRNSGAQYLQGNRNPFIDHPEYACKIWGSTNSTTKQICGL